MKECCQLPIDFSCCTDSPILLAARVNFPLWRQLSKRRHTSLVDISRGQLGLYCIQQLLTFKWHQKHSPLHYFWFLFSIQITDNIFNFTDATWNAKDPFWCFITLFVNNGPLFYLVFTLELYKYLDTVHFWIFIWRQCMSFVITIVSIHSLKTFSSAAAFSVIHTTMQDGSL